jgi:hypothetical protein
LTDKKIKITDRRMFTPDGELREDFRFLEDEGAAGPSSAAVEPAGAAAGERGPSPPPAAAEPAAGGPPLEFPATPGAYGQPTFYDLVGLLAEPVALYLGDVELPDGGSAENLDMARLHIDLLDVLRRKTAGNLTAQELATLDDLLYRLRMRYVQKRG